MYLMQIIPGPAHNSRAVDIDWAQVIIGWQKLGRASPKANVKIAGGPGLDLQKKLRVRHGWPRFRPTRISFRYRLAYRIQLMTQEGHR